jgi:hypothetical protein
MVCSRKEREAMAREELEDLAEPEGFRPFGEEAKKRFSSLLRKVNQKRLRRVEYALETGTIPPAGWTPPDPQNRATQNVAPYTRFWKH